MAVKNKGMLLALGLAALLIIALMIGISSFVLTAPPSSFTSSTPRPSPVVPTPSPSLPPQTVSACECAANQQPLYDRFPKPAHTPQSYAVFNFYNDHGVDENGEDITVWVSMYATADARMASDDARFENSYTYVYVDAKKLMRGETYSYTMSRDITAQGRVAGGRICVYYENPALNDALRNSKYGGVYPVQTSAGGVVKISSAAGLPAIPSDSYSQLLEFTLDVDPGQDINTKAFIDYDLSAVDTIALPVYIFGGYDSRTLPGATNGTNNNGFPCGKAYIGCSQRAHETTEGCPTQVVEKTVHGSVCISSLKYCALVRDADLAASTLITNKTNWQQTCHKFDAIAERFGITRTLLDLFHDCAVRGSTTSPCPPIIPPDVTTPTNVIYGCAGQFLLENHCKLDGSRYTRSRLDGAQCSALNRGLCFQPNYSHVPLPSGLSCARVAPCAEPGPCLVPCYNYSCFGNLCRDYNPPIAGCADHTGDISKSRQSLCNDSTPGPYAYPQLLKNDYAGWARTKGERFYSFSLDEEVGGGNQQCLFSTQLDVVVFPRCAGNSPG